MIVYFFIIMTSALITMLLIRTQGWHGRFSVDDRAGTQNVHHQPVPRIGGVAIALSFLGYAIFESAKGNPLPLLTCLAALPIIIGGLMDDLRFSHHTMLRITTSFISAGLFILLTGYYVSNIELPLLRVAFDFAPFAILITGLAIAGISQAFNIIDGYNGLSTGTFLIGMFSLAILAWRVDDPVMISFCLAGCAAVFGFFFFNYPSAQVFQGDSGAYFIGFLISVAVIALTARNPELSPWVASLVLLYPATETLFSIYRKTKRAGHRFDRPDGVHLHMLIYRSYGRRAANWLGGANMRNPATAMLLWLITLASAIAQQISFGHPTIAQFFFVAFAVCYILLYRKVSLIAAQRKQQKKNRGKT